jgi:WD40 repeat protein
LAGHAAGVSAGARFLPDGRTLISGSGDAHHRQRDNSVRLWDVASGQELHRFEEHSEYLWAVALSPDGRVALSASRDGTFRRWILDALSADASLAKDEQESLLLDISPQGAHSVALSPDGGTALLGLDEGKSAHPDYGLRLVDVETGHEIRRLEGHTEAVIAIAFSPDGRQALSGTFGSELLLWDVQQGQVQRRLEGHNGGINAIAFSPDGRLAVTGSHDESLIVWDVATGQARRRFLGHQGEVLDVCFPSVRTVFSCGADLTVREWRIDATQDDLLAWIGDNRYVPDLTPEQRARYYVDLLQVQDRTTR